uniref:N-ATPase, AtpR subunit n=1 Tax=mine drainage metagenome TaxID=410659 RepID=E6QVZ4_9ZZZZ
MMLLVLTTFSGMLLGAMYFGGLWWTVRKGLASPRPAQWFIFSLLLRLGLALLGFYFVAGNDWKQLLVCLLGFIVARIIVIRLTETQIAKGASHAP